MKFIHKKYCNWISFFLLLSGVLLIGGLSSRSLEAAELGYEATGKKMLFTIPYETVPEINALFSDRGERVVLILPSSGLKIKIQEHPLDDDWVTAFGIEKEGQELHWYLKKRDPALRVKSFLALERKDSALQVVLLKEYRPWSAPVRTDKPVAQLAENLVETKASGKMARIKQLLDKSAGGDDEVASEVDDTAKSAPSFLMSGLRSLIALVFLVLIIVALSLLLKRYRRGRGGIGGSRLIKVLGIETVSGKHQVMLLELLDEVMVVGISGEQMTVLTTIKEPDKVEELRLLQDGSQSGRRFGGYLQGFVDKGTEPEGVVSDAKTQDAEIIAAYPSSVAVTSENLSDKQSEQLEELPENYQEVVSQIKDRLKNGDGSRLG